MLKSGTMVGSKYWAWCGASAALPADSSASDAPLSAETALLTKRAFPFFPFMRLEGGGDLKAADASLTALSSTETNMLDPLSPNPKLAS